jgi:hypothetical protein
MASSLTLIQRFSYTTLEPVQMISGASAGGLAGFIPFPRIVVFVATGALQAPRGHSAPIHALRAARIEACV